MKTQESSTRSAPQRTQEERGAIMRAALIQATLDLVFEHGWAGLRTAQVAKRAGVSSGALTHHFSTKRELAIAAADELAGRFFDRVENLFEEESDEKQKLETFFEQAWQMFSNYRLNALWIEVLTAARTDEGLRKEVVAKEEYFISALTMRIARRLTANKERQSLIHHCFRLNTFVLRGMGLEKIIQLDTTDQRTFFDLWKRMVFATVFSNET